MATALLEKRLLNYKDKQTKNIPLNQLYVSFYLDMGPKKGESTTISRGDNVQLNTFALDKLFVKEDVRGKQVSRPLRSYEEFIKLYPQGKVFVNQSCQQKVEANGRVNINGKYYVNRTEPYYASFDVDKEYETDVNVEQTSFVDKKPIVTESAVPYGLQRTAKVLENELTDNDNYLMVHFEDSRKQDFIKKSGIYYKEGNSLVYLYQPGRNIDFSKVKGKTLYYGNRIIDDIYTEKEYSFGDLTKFENVDATKLEKNEYVLIENPSEDDKNDEQVVKLNGLYYKKSNSEKQDQYYSIANQVLLEVPDPNNIGKTKKESFYAVNIYSINQSGDYLSLRVKGDNKVSMINISKFVDKNGNEIHKSNILNYVGKPIYVKDENNKLLETEPLNYNQAVYFYEKQFSYEPSLSEADILADNAYLQTKNGEFVKENLVRPISYKFTDADDCDAYLITVKTEEGNVSKVVAAKDFAKETKNLEVINQFNLETTDFNNSQVIQTTNGKIKTTVNDKTVVGNVKVNNCVVLCKYDAESKKFENLKDEEKTAIQADILKNFNQNYKDGLYNVDSVYDEAGNKIELKERSKRFVYSDTHYMKDYAGNSWTYSGLNNSTVSYDFKDGKLGKFKGNAKVSFKKMCGKAYGIWAKALVTYLAVSMSPIGLLASLAAPFVVVGAGVAIGVAPIVIPIVAGVRCWFKNVLNRKFVDKTKHNRKNWNKDLAKELEFVNENMKTTSLTKGLNKSAFIAKIIQLKNDALASSKCTVGDGFKVVDGKVVVTGENVNDVIDFKKEHKKELKDLKSKNRKLSKLKRKMDKAYQPYEKLLKQGIDINEEDKKYKKYLKKQKAYNDFKEIYEKQEKKFNRNVTSKQGEAHTYDKHKDVDENLTKIENLENFWMIKKFTSDEELAELGFTAEEVQQLKEVEYNIKKNTFKTKHDEFKLDELVEKQKDEAAEKKPDKEEASSDEKARKTKVKKEKEPTKREVERERTRALLIKLKTEMNNRSEQKVKDKKESSIDEEVTIPKIDKPIESETATTKLSDIVLDDKKDLEKPKKVVPVKEKDKDSKEMSVGKNAKVESGLEKGKADVNNSELKNQPTKIVKEYNSDIVSEDSLVKLLKARTDNKERQKVLDYISKKSGKAITESDIQETIERINEKHNPSSGESVAAIKYAARLKNKNIFIILDYGQRYLTEYAKKIKQRISKSEATANSATQKIKNGSNNTNQIKNNQSEEETIASVPNSNI